MFRSINSGTSVFQVEADLFLGDEDDIAFEKFSFTAVFLTDAVGGNIVFYRKFSRSGVSIDRYHLDFSLVQ